jgi:hypothetical protein
MPDMGALWDSVIPPGTDPAVVAERIAIVEEPRTVGVGAAEGVAIALREEQGGQAVIRRYVFVNFGVGRVYQFILEAPAEQWDKSVGTLEGILQSARFASTP